MLVGVYLRYWNGMNIVIGFFIRTFRFSFWTAPETESKSDSFTSGNFPNRWAEKHWLLYGRKDCIHWTVDIRNTYSCYHLSAHSFPDGRDMQVFMLVIVRCCSVQPSCNIFRPISCSEEGWQTRIFKPTWRKVFILENRETKLFTIVSTWYLLNFLSCVSLNRENIFKSLISVNFC